MLNAVAEVTPQPLVSHAATKPATAQQSEKALHAYGRLPLSFEANEGQTDARVDFLARGSGYAVFLTPQETVLSFQKQKPDSANPTKVALQDPGLAPTEKPNNRTQTTIRSVFVGANPQAQSVGLEQQGQSNYLLGNDKSKWRTGISRYAKVQYTDLYPGIDLKYTGQQSQLSHEFVVQPDANPESIQLQFQGVEKTELDANGNLILKNAAGIALQTAPRISQTINGKTQTIAGQYLLKSNDQVALAIGQYNAKYPLTIEISTPLSESAFKATQEPQKLAQAANSNLAAYSYSTYLGGSGRDEGYSIAVDSSGNVYITGDTESANFPVANAIDSTLGGGPRDVFVTKLNASGKALVYSTYLGGGSSEEGYGIAVDGSGNVYLTGDTSSSDFPVVNALDDTLSNATGNAFVTKLNASGNALIYSTYLGAGVGGTSDSGRSIAVDRSGNAYVTGITSATGFPVVNAIDPNLSGSTDAFVTKINASGSQIVYSTFLGGSSQDEGYSIAVDSSGNAYIAGFTRSSDLPRVNAIVPSFAGGFSDGFVTKINASGTALVYSTYLGGRDDDFAQSIAVDSSGNAYVTGTTESDNFPVVNALYPTIGGSDAFVTKFDASGTALFYSTYLGGTGSDGGGGIAVDSSGNAYVTGTTLSSNFPLANALDSTLSGQRDTFVTKLNALGSALIYSTYLGGSRDEYGRSIAVDSRGSAYITGRTFSSDFPLANAFDPSFGGGDHDVFVTKIATFTFKGFQAPLKTNELNVVPSVRLLPIRWRLTDGNGQPVTDPDSFASLKLAAVSCDDFSGLPLNSISLTPGSTQPRFPGLTLLEDDTWQYNWLVRKRLEQQCFNLQVEFSDGSLSPVVPLKVE